MTDTKTVDLEVQIQTLYSDSHNKDCLINSLKNLLDEKINYRDRDLDCKKFVKDLKNFKSHLDFSKFLKEASGKIEH